MKRTLFPLALAALLLASCSSSTLRKTNSDEFDAIDLPDGSVALLNSNSSIEFDEEFNLRTVKQTGEVFYSVTKGQSTFTVETDNGKIVVLGTEFNVKSSEDDLEVEVEEGVVKLKTDKDEKDIKRGQKATVSRSEKGIKTEKAEFNYRNWTKQVAIHLNKMGKEINKGSKEVGKETRKIGKELNKLFKK